MKIRAISCLKQHLRQADVATVARYAISVMRGEMVSDEQKALTVHVMEKAAFEGLDLRGSFGAHLIARSLGLK